MLVSQVKCFVFNVTTNSKHAELLMFRVAEGAQLSSFCTREKILKPKKKKKKSTLVKRDHFFIH